MKTPQLGTKTPALVFHHLVRYIIDQLRSISMLIRIIIAVICLLSCTQVEKEVDNSTRKTADQEQSVLSLPATQVDTPIIDPSGQLIIDRFKLPKGFQRVSTQTHTFAHFLQHFPLKEAGHKVMLFDGREKYRQDVHEAVLDIDVGKRDLQQCADAIMRLRSEYLWKEERFSDIHFNFTNGFRAEYKRWRAGERIQVKGNQVNWVRRQSASESYASFRQYLVMVFSYAGTLSLAKELKPQDLATIDIGDVFIQGGSPGHAILVMDKAVHEQTGEVLVLLAQSYMPAQDIHILRNPTNTEFSPWYSTKNFSTGVDTPEWNFTLADLKKF